MNPAHHDGIDERTASGSKLNAIAGGYSRRGPGVTAGQHDCGDERNGEETKRHNAPSISRSWSRPSRSSSLLIRNSSASIFRPQLRSPEHIRLRLTEQYTGERGDSPCGSDTCGLERNGSPVSSQSKLVRMVFNKGEALDQIGPRSKLPIPYKCLKELAGTTRLELATSAVTGQRSNQLNYVPTC